MLTTRRIGVAVGLTICSILCAPPTVQAQDAFDKTVFTRFSVVLWVTDVRRSVEFYRTVLGFRLQDYTIGEAKSVTTLAPTDPEPYGAVVLFGDHRLTLQRGLQGQEPVGVRFVIQVEDPAAYAASLAKRGASVGVIATSKDRPYWFAVSDPDGHRFEFSGGLGSQ